MTQEWKIFLEQQGAEFNQETIAHFGTFDRECRLVCAGTVIAALTTYRVLKFSGSDAQEFLSNQLTNDVNDVSETLSQYNAWCTHQGKVLATLLLLKKDDHYLALVASDLIDTITKRLEMFIMHSDVQITLEPEICAIEIAGPKARVDLEKANLPTPENNFEQIIEDDIIFTKLLSLSQRYLITGSQKSLQPIWQRLDVNAAPVGENARNLLDIRAGIPQINDSNTEIFTPHMLNMQDIPMVNFKKGCYPGQEVVARMQYLGKNKRAMYHIIIDTNKLINAGEKLFSNSSTSQKGAGQIVQSAVNGDGKIEALAVLDLTAVENDDLQDAGSHSVGFMELSYT